MVLKALSNLNDSVLILSILSLSIPFYSLLSYSILSFKEDGKYAEEEVVKQEKYMYFILWKKVLNWKHSYTFEH